MQSQNSDGHDLLLLSLLPLILLCFLGPPPEGAGEDEPVTSSERCPDEGNAGDAEAGRRRRFFSLGGRRGAVRAPRALMSSDWDLGGRGGGGTPSSGVLGLAWGRLGGLAGEMRGPCLAWLEEAGS